MRQYLANLTAEKLQIEHELETALEESHSSNEELEIRMEELNTAKEELESANDHLRGSLDELLQRNEELDRTRNDLDSVLASVRLPVLVLDPDARIRRFTAPAARFFSLHPSDIGRPLFDLRHRLDCPDLADIIKQVLNTYEPVEREVWGMEGRWFVLRVLAYKNKQNQLDGAVLVLVDIDRLKRSEQSLAETSTRLKEVVGELEGFSYTISHDMRAPLRAMSGFANMALTEGGGQLSPVIRDYLKRIIEATQRQDRFIRDVLAYSRLVRSEVRLGRIELEPVLRGVVQERSEMLPPNAEIDIQSPLLPVLGHEAYLSQSVVNLLTNAVKFVAPEVKPHIVVRTERRGRRVRIWIEDNGIGIDRAQQERIFKIFERLHGPEAYEGTGIGLAIVRKAVERMGGAVGVESQPGVGSKFWLELEGVEEEGAAPGP